MSLSRRDALIALGGTAAVYTPNLVCTPLIVNWPGGTRRAAEIYRGPRHITNLMAAFTEVPGATYPEEFKGNRITPPAGRSFLPALCDVAAQHPELVKSLAAKWEDWARRSN